MKWGNCLNRGSNMIFSMAYISVANNVSQDLFGEGFYIRYGKGVSGLKGNTQHAVWVVTKWIVV